jgi:hypothetical protein
MNEEKITAVLKLAEKLSGQVAAELQVVAFESCFRALMLSGPSAVVKEPDDDGKSNASGTDDRISEKCVLIASWLGVSHNQVQEVIEFGEASVDIMLEHLHDGLPKSNVARQQQLAQYKMAVDRKAYGRQAVPVHELNQLFRRHDCFDTNVATNLRKLNTVRINKDKGSVQYSIMLAGLDIARDGLAALLKA